MEQNEYIIQAESVKCRTCLQETYEIYHLKSQYRHGNRSYELEELIHYICNWEPCANITASLGICVDCMQKLVDAFIFAKMIEDSGNYWCNLQLNNETQIETKIEDCHDDIEFTDIIMENEEAFMHVVEYNSETNDSTEQHNLTELKHNAKIQDKCDIDTSLEVAKSNTLETAKDIDLLRPFACEHCKSRFNIKANLTFHLRSRHGICFDDSGNFVCPHCPRQFPRKRYLEQHLRLLHTDIYKPTEIADNLRSHLCEYCGQMKRRIKDHIWRHQGNKPYKCQYCNLSFVGKGKCVEHERIHTGEKPCKCDVCGNCFRKNSQLISHMLTHTKTKSYKCTRCDEAFVGRQQLKHHTNVKHTGERPNKCDVCEKAFASSTRLAIHRKKFKHNVDPTKDIFAKVRVGQNRIRWKS